MKICITLFLLISFAGAANPPVESMHFFDMEPRQPADIPNISLLRLQSSRCLTRCPAFTVTLRRDGSFSYHGEDAVAHLGEHRGQVERGEYEQILRYIGEIGFMDLKTRYTSPYLDNGSSAITIVQGGKRKTVTVSAGSGPATLWALEKLVTDLLGHATWVARAQVR